MFSPHNLAVPRLSQPRTYRTQAVRQCRTQKVWHCRTQTAWHCHTQTVRHCCSIARGMVQQCREHTEYIPTLLMCINETTMSLKNGNCETLTEMRFSKEGPCNTVAHHHKYPEHCRGEFSRHRYMGIWVLMQQSFGGITRWMFCGCADIATTIQEIDMEYLKNIQKYS